MFNQLAREGFYLVRSLLDAKTTTECIDLVSTNAITEDGRGGVRNLLDTPAIRELAESPRVLKLVSDILGDGAFAVRGILFDKTDGANWKVPWHQDVTIAVTNRIDTDGFGPWSVKAGVMHVQPPAQVLEKMISVRIHLDDCPASNGALRVLPSTHNQGKLGHAAIDAEVSRGISVTCEANAGDALVMRPLLVHASSPSSTPNHRRVIHFDYANVELPNGLEWRERDVFSCEEFIGKGQNRTNTVPQRLKPHCE